jgi:MYXO-CTERM domain-containing protein
VSTFCVDGVCCNDDCTGQCEACNLAGKAGTCSPVKGKPVTPRAACVGNGTGCDGSCNGVQTTACVVPGQSTQCRAPSCTAAVATLAEFCDGSGACPVKRTQDCKPGICGVSQCTGCSTNATCPPGNFCRGGVCKPLADTGTACSIDAECTSGHCVDGVCCNADCTGQCEACNQTDHVGQCTPIPKGELPARGRPGCAGGDGQCGGQCDGNTTRSCVYPGPGVSCQAAKCENGIATLVAFCDGGGHCPADSQQTCPTGYECEGDLCAGGPSACVAENDCNSDQFCSGGVCRERNGAGTACNTSAECASGICVDGVCCTDPCTGQCEACNVAGSEGTCIPVVGAPVGSRQACASDGTVCAGSCDGAVGDRCAYKGAGTACRPGTCKNGLAELAAFCQGNGACAPRQQQSCDPLTCDTAAVQCAGPCKANTDCKTTEFCAAGMCVGKQTNGATCGSPSHCVSGHCVDGRCCDTACDGQCASCDQVGHLGTCMAIAGAPRDGRPSCQGGGACGGFCEGTNAATCALPGATEVCGEGFCANGVATKAPTCNGAATCVIPPVASCDPYQCDDDKVSCRTGCRDDNDCTTGLVCDPVQGGCVQPVQDGGSIGHPDASAGGNGGTESDGGEGGGGAAGTAGTTGQGTGGRTGSGGATTSVDGGVTAGRDAGANQGADAGKADGKDDGSCGCRVPGSRDTGSRGALALLALGLVAARRRRATRASLTN